MVLFKRRKVDVFPLPASLKYAPNTEVWEITQTGELFTNYETYLERRDFYLQKDFTCEITGHSNMTFYDAFESETASYREVDSLFPEPLRGPVLKQAQFSTLGRLEYLVTYIYDIFKHDFWPKEHVIAILENSDKAEGVVREKVQLNQRVQNGVIIMPAMTNYLITLDADPSAKRSHAMDVQVEGQNVYRDRRHFSKVLLRSFLKGALTKESWHGAPWIVKPKLALAYGIPTDIPIALQQHVIQAERKAMAKKTGEVPPNVDQTTFFNYLTSKQRPLEVRNGSMKGNGQKHRFIQQDISKYMRPDDPNYGQFPAHLGPIPPGWLPGPDTPPLPGQVLPPHEFPENPYQSGFQLPSVPSVPVKEEIVVPPPPPPPIKFPMEDIDVPPKKDAKPRPNLKFYSDDTPSGEEIEDPLHAGLHMSSMGSLLEIWDSLNVHSEVFILDSFTLDDFAEAMRFPSAEVECELLNEVHCAVLKQIVNEQGELQISLPEFEHSDSEDEDDEDEEEEEESREPTPEPVFRRSTRSSLKKEEAAALIAKSPTPEETQVHQAEEMLGDRSWIDRLKERDFRDGGWHVIMVGLLHQISLMPRKKGRCDKILSILAPIDVEIADDTAKWQYFEELDINLRIDALQMITMFAIGTKAIRQHLEDMSAEMTELRKKKIEQQRLKKDMVEQLQKIDEERKALVAEIQAKLPQADVNGQADVEIPEVPAVNGNAESRDNSEDDAPPVVLRRGKRKREDEAARKEKARKKAAEPKRTKEEIKLDKIMDQIDNKKVEILETEEKIGEYTNDLRETDCQRTKCLGRDRFCNRYVWFERNGMPFGGVPHTSTAHYNYANGRIWVQGPDEMDRPLIDLDKETQAEYVHYYDMTVPERKEREEGETHLEDSTHWAFIDSPEDVDQLISWLDERGFREKALRKELVAWREVIVDCMKRMQQHMDEVAAKRVERNTGEKDALPPVRHSARTKNAAQHRGQASEIDKTEWQCLAWTNSLALEQFGMLHSDGIKKRRSKGIAERKGAASANASANANAKAGAKAPAKSGGHGKRS